MSRHTKIEYTLLWHDLKLPILATPTKFDLGLAMGDYATLYALNKLFGVTAVLNGDQKYFLDTHFTNLSLPVLNESKLISYCVYRTCE